MAVSIRTEWRPPCRMPVGCARSARYAAESVAASDRASPKERPSSWRNGSPSTIRRCSSPRSGGISARNGQSDDDIGPPASSEVQGPRRVLPRAPDDLLLRAEEKLPRGTGHLLGPAGRRHEGPFRER